MAPTKRKYRILQGRIGRYEGEEPKDYARKGLDSKDGHFIMLTKDEAARYGKDRVELVTADDEDEEPESKTTAIANLDGEETIDPAAERAADLAAMTEEMQKLTVTTAREKIDQVDDLALLDLAAEGEKAGHNRKGVLAAIADRIAELKAK